MNIDKDNGVRIGFLNCVLHIFAILVLFLCVVVLASQRDALRQDDVSLGYAEFNARSGHWQWITNNINTNKLEKAK